MDQTWPRGDFDILTSQLAPQLAAMYKRIGWTAAAQAEAQMFVYAPVQ